MPLQQLGGLRINLQGQTLRHHLHDVVIRIYHLAKGLSNALRFSNVRPRVEYR